MTRLYDEDFYAWTLAQAKILCRGHLDEADVASLIEEIESSGRKKVAELRSRLKVLADHLMKETYQPDQATRSGVATIINQRDEIAWHLQDNPSLKRKTEEIRRA